MNSHTHSLSWFLPADHCRNFLTWSWVEDHTILSKFVNIINFIFLNFSCVVAPHGPSQKWTQSNEFLSVKEKLTHLIPCNMQSHSNIKAKLIITVTPTWEKNALKQKSCICFFLTVWV
jgi:hypothetical protein